MGTDGIRGPLPGQVNQTGLGKTAGKQQTKQVLSKDGLGEATKNAFQGPASSVSGQKGVFLPAPENGADAAVAGDTAETISGMVTTDEGGKKIVDLSSESLLGTWYGHQDTSSDEVQSAEFMQNLSVGTLDASERDRLYKVYENARNAAQKFSEDTGNASVQQANLAVMSSLQEITTKNFPAIASARQDAVSVFKLDPTAAADQQNTLPDLIALSAAIGNRNISEMPYTLYKLQETLSLAQGLGSANIGNFSAGMANLANTLKGAPSASAATPGATTAGKPPVSE